MREEQEARAAGEAAKKRTPAYVKALFIVSLLLCVLLLPALVWLWTGGAAEAGIALDEVPYREAPVVAQEQTLYIQRDAEACVIRIPQGGAARLIEDTAARTLYLETETAATGTSPWTITADVDLLAGAAYYRAGQTETYAFMLTTYCTAELISSEEAQLLRLHPITAASDETTLLIDVRDAAGVSQTRGSALADTDAGVSPENAAAEIARTAATLLRETGWSAVYVLGGEREAMTEADNVAFLAACAPDIYLRLSFSEDDAVKTCALCNPDCFQPTLDSIVLAENVLRGVLVQIKDETSGVRAAEAGDAILAMEIPACALVLGVPVEAAEGETADTAAYRMRAAYGIRDGILAALQYEAQ